MEPEDLGELVRRAGAGDNAAWDALVDRFTPLLWAVARGFRLGSADAGDLVQTVWLRLVEHLGSVQDPQRLGAWLTTTARREALQLLRRSGRERPLDGPVVENLPAEAAAPDAALLSQERDLALWRAFARLPEHCQKLLRILVAVPTPSYEEVAAVLGRPVGSLGPTRQRCLRKLIELVRSEGIDAPTRASDYEDRRGRPRQTREGRRP